MSNKETMPDIIWASRWQNSGYGHGSWHEVPHPAVNHTEYLSRAESSRLVAEAYERAAMLCQQYAERNENDVSALVLSAEIRSLKNQKGE